MHLYDEMDFVKLLTLLSIIYAILTGLVYLKCRSIVFVVGFALIYYWTFFGAWIIVFVRKGDFVSPDLEFIESNLLYAELNSSYFNSLLWYGVFAITILLTIFVACKSRPSVPKRLGAPIAVSIRRLYLVAIVSQIISFIILREHLFEAIFSGSSVYSIVGSRRYEIPGFFIHSFMMRVSVLAVGLAIVTSLRSHDRLLLEKFKELRIYDVLLLAIVSVSVVGYLTILGNKNELLFGILIAWLFYIEPQRNTVKGAQILFFACLIIFMSSINYMRDFSLSTGGDGFSFGDLFRRGIDSIVGSEAFAAHLALYGIFEHSIGSMGGLSYISLVEGLSPPGLIEPSAVHAYAFYSAEAGASDRIYFTIHHAAGWWLNWGPVGLLVGAVLLGLMWSGFHRYYASWFDNPAERNFGNALVAFLFFSFTGFIPDLIRAGLEVYKGVMIFTILVPLTLILVASVNLNKEKVNNK